MMFFVMAATKPFDFHRLKVILMVGIGRRFAASLTWLGMKNTKFNSRVNYLVSEYLNLISPVGSVLFCDSSVTLTNPGLHLRSKRLTPPVVSDLLTILANVLIAQGARLRLVEFGQRLGLFAVGAIGWTANGFQPLLARLSALRSSTGLIVGLSGRCHSDFITLLGQNFKSKKGVVHDGSRL